jgi:hypothetical protein
MDSPYRPGYGARPTVMVGREAQLDRARTTLTLVANRRAAATTTLVLTGARGLGKTVTLQEIRDEADARGYVTAQAQLDPVTDSIDFVARALGNAVAPFDRGTREALWRRFTDRLQALSLELNAGVVKVTSGAPAAPRTPEQRLTQRQVLTDLLVEGARLARAHDRTGLVLLLDELQAGDADDLAVLVNSLQDAATTPDAPLAVFAAGLSTTPEKVTAAASFAERFDFRALPRLDDAECVRALVEPALSLNVRWSDEALEHVVDFARGSPYLIQSCGDEVWNVARPSPEDQIGITAARRGVDNAREGMEHGLFRSRWSKATPAEQLLLVAIAQCADATGIASTRAITELTERSTPQLSSARRSLLDKGIIESAGHGKLQFTIAGFDDYVLDTVGVERLGPGELSGRRALGRRGPA